MTPCAKHGHTALTKWTGHKVKLTNRDTDLQHGDYTRLQILLIGNQPNVMHLCSNNADLVKILFLLLFQLYVMYYVLNSLPLI